MKPRWSHEKRSHYEIYRLIPKTAIEHNENKMMNSTSVWQRNGIMLCLNQYTSIVKWSDKDNFTYDNYDSVWIISILKVHAWYFIFPKHPRTSSDTLRHFCEKGESKEVLSFIRWIHYWPSDSMSTDLLGDFAANAMHGPTIHDSYFKHQCIQWAVTLKEWWHLNLYGVKW